MPFLGCMVKVLSPAISAMTSEYAPAAFTTIFGRTVPRLVLTAFITPSDTSMLCTIVLSEIFAPFSTAFSARAMVTL